MKSARILIPLFVLALPRLAGADKPTVDAKAAQAAEKKAEAAVRNTINATAKAIDRCTGRYLQEQPAARGQARIDAKVAKDGWVTDAEARTSLPEARTLRRCLENVAKGWRFPKPRGPTTMGITVAVAEGATFKVLSPEERKALEAKAKEAAKKNRDKPEGFLKLQPGSFLPSFPQPPGGTE